MKTSNIIILGGIVAVWTFSFISFGNNMREAKRHKAELQPFVDRLAETPIECIRLTSTDNVMFQTRLGELSAYNLKKLSDKRITIRTNYAPNAADFHITGDTLVYSGTEWVRFTVDRVNVIFPDGSSELFEDDRTWRRAAVRSR